MTNTLDSLIALARAGRGKVAASPAGLPQTSVRAIINGHMVEVVYGVGITFNGIEDRVHVDRSNLPVSPAEAADLIAAA